MPEDDDVVTSVTDTEADAKDITIYTEQDDIVVSSTPNVELQRIVVVDMAGKHQVYNVSGRYAALSLPLNRGIYTVHVIGDNAVKTEKVHIY
jgi:NACalpha-BTF3-like transcription factor